MTPKTDPSTKDDSLSATSSPRKPLVEKANQKQRKNKGKKLIARRGAGKTQALKKFREYLEQTFGKKKKAIKRRQALDWATSGLPLKLELDPADRYESNSLELKSILHSTELLMTQKRQKTSKEVGKAKWKSSDQIRKPLSLHRGKGTSKNYIPWITEKDLPVEKKPSKGKKSDK